MLNSVCFYTFYILFSILLVLKCKVICKFVHTKFEDFNKYLYVICMVQKNYKAIAFIRVSSIAQHLESQKQEVYNVIHRHGYSDDEVLCIEHKESAIKLAAEDRVSLQQLYSAIDKYSTIEFVFVYEISRLTRQSKMMFEIRDFLIERKVNLYCMKPEFTLLDNDFKLSQTASIMFSIFTSLSESEMMLKKERMRRGAEYKHEQGKYWGGSVAIGYKVEDERLVIDEHNAAMVKRIFNEYNDGKSVRQLARELQAEGWRPNTAFLTVCQSILNILHREYYCGDKWHPQIISRELFNKCRDIAHNKIVYKKNTTEALLKGLMYDMNTGYLMSSNMAAGQYYCKRYGNTTISMKAADTLIGGLADEWYNIISSYKIDELRTSIRNDIARYERIVKQQEKNITDNQDKIDRIEERYIDGKISKQRADELEKQAFEQMMHYRNTLNEAHDKIVQLNNELEQVHPNVHSLRDKVLYVVDSIYVRRISRFVCEINVTNKWTCEVRTYEYNTRKLIIHKMSVKLIDTLNYIP